MPDQFDLFDHRPEPRATPPPVAATPAPAEVHALAQRLPPGLRLGTSSWSFPGWRGVVYDRDASPAVLARHGLPAYACHPLLRAVGVDRTYYAPLAADEFARMAAATPPEFRFLVKAHDALTALPGARAAGRPPGSAAGGDERDLFLNPSYAADEVVAPFVEGLGPRGGCLVFQFSRMLLTDVGGPGRFLERLHAFLAALPKGPPYAVEIRNPTLLTADYARLLADAGAAHCFSAHPDLPPIARQLAVVAPRAGQPVVPVRWMLHRSLRYEAARERYAPFDALVDEDPGTRHEIRDLALAAAARGLPVIVIANNKAEGSAPWTCIRLAQAVADATPF